MASIRVVVSFKRHAGWLWEFGEEGKWEKRANVQKLVVLLAGCLFGTPPMTAAPPIGCTNEQAAKTTTTTTTTTRKTSTSSSRDLI